MHVPGDSCEELDMKDVCIPVYHKHKQITV